MIVKCTTVFPKQYEKVQLFLDVGQSGANMIEKVVVKSTTVLKK